ncbi:DUF427 domain-containing protein [Yinghuangia seranimata]|uniref:DUF427 domain-containing protein n=1 Tax=Yinghuangia seranimata TaxID=408067 RepID=UPI00248C8EF7|nr:DUF427 domain-containing protein [Yinghuangia seranimata]MDI2130412.1 DUF427 domain-containing protein [Yinghuangia seranimata]
MTIDDTGTTVPAQAKSTASGRIRVEVGAQRVRVEVGGVVVAESGSPRVLFETGLPARYYLPKGDVRMELLEGTDTSTHCPYKGDAEYWSVRVGDRVYADVAWSYPEPITEESAGIAGLVAFWNVDLYVDGVLQAG